MSDYGYRSSSSPEGGRFFDNSDMPEHRGNSRSNPYGDHGSFGADARGGSAYGSSSGGWGSSEAGGYDRPSSSRHGSTGHGASNYGSSSYGSAGHGSAGAGSGSAYGSGRLPAASDSNPYGGGNGGRSSYGSSGHGSAGSASPYGGSASVGGGGSAYGGSAAVGGASVGGASVPPPKGPPGDDLGDASPTSGAAGSARGSASVTGRRPKGVRSEEELASMKKKKKKKRRRKVYIAMAAVFIMFMGGITVAAAMFFQSVDLPENLTLEETSFVSYADGEEMGSYGQYQRKLINEEEEITDELRWATLALEDRNFYEHQGVDFKGVMRAVWNNVSGGDTQGASTLSQQYAGQLADIRDDISYTRKASEAVIAMKMDNEMSKEEILLNYLNIAYFGRGAYGVAAASEAYFDKDFTDLDYDEAVFVVMQVQSPNGRYDPEFDHYEEENTANRWSYGMDGLVSVEHLTSDERAEFEDMPDPVEFTENSGTSGANDPIGFVSHGYVYQELRDRYGITFDELYGNDGHDGGFDITLTIDKQLQDEAEALSNRGELNEDQDGFVNDKEDAYLYHYEDNMTNSLVAIEPETGKVKAYYGGPDGTGIDKAGQESPHPPSSTFKTITTAMAIDEMSASIESWWDATSGRTFPSLVDSEQEEDGIRNSGDSSNPPELTLEQALVDSKNTPMFAIAEEAGASRILELAAKMGLSHMARNDNNYEFSPDGTVTRYGTEEDEDGNLKEDENGNIDRWIPMDPDDDGNAQPVPIDHENSRSIVDNHVSFGQYGVSVFDMAVIYATVANDGMYQEPHFIEEVLGPDGEPVPEIRELDSGQALQPQIAHDLQYVGNKIEPTPGGLNDGRNYFGKTGTWERDCNSDEMSPSCETGQNSHLWYVGAIPQLSVAAWIGDVGDENGLLYNEHGGTDNVFGGTIAGPLWAEYMHRAISAKEYEPLEWTPHTKVGSPTNGEMHDRPADELNPDGQFCANNRDHGPCRDAADDDDEDEDDEDDPRFGDEWCEDRPNNPFCDDDGEDDDENGDNGDDEDNRRGDWPDGDGDLAS